MTSREARCACGSLVAVAEGEPVRVSICHCLDCKRRSGAAFSWTATYAADKVRIEGAYETYARGSDDGFRARFHFCGQCGTSLYYEIERRPGMVSIPAGAFADR